METPSDPTEHFHVKAGYYTCFDLKNHRTRYSLVPRKSCIEHDGGEFKESDPVPIDSTRYRLQGLSLDRKGVSLRVVKKGGKKKGKKDRGTKVGY